MYPLTGVAICDLFNLPLMDIKNGHFPQTSESEGVIRKMCDKRNVFIELSVLDGTHGSFLEMAHDFVHILSPHFCRLFHT